MQRNPSADKVVHNNATYSCFALSEIVVRRKKSDTSFANFLNEPIEKKKKLGPHRPMLAIGWCKVGGINVREECQKKNSFRPLSQGTRNHARIKSFTTVNPPQPPARLCQKCFGKRQVQLLAGELGHRECSSLLRFLITRYMCLLPSSDWFVPKF